METDKVIPNCSHCKEFLIWEDGDGWNEPRVTEIDCLSEVSSDEEVEQFLSEFEHDVRKCSGFEPLIVDKCSHCGKELNMETYNVKYSDCTYETNYYCSQECKQESWEEFKKEMNI